MMRNRLTRSIAALAFLLAAAPAAAQANGGVTTVILVRHAEKDVAPAGDPVLTAAGSARAAALADLLAERGVAGVVVTEFARTRLTAEPLAARLGLTPVVTQARGGLREHAAAVAELARTAFEGKTVLVVGHSNTLPAIVAALGAGPVDPICDGEYGNLYVVTLSPDGPPGLERRHYGAPDPADACAPAMR